MSQSFSWLAIMSQNSSNSICPLSAKRRSREGCEGAGRGWEGGGVGGGGVAVLQLVGHHVAELVEFDLTALIIVRWCN